MFARFFLACALALAPAIQTANGQAAWKTVGASRQMNISGMALIEHNPQQTSFIVVHDNKKPEQKRVAIVSISANAAPQYTPLVWAGDDVPGDLEAITAVPGGTTQTFMALTAAGRVFHLRLDQQHNSVEVIKSFVVPAIAADSNFEGFALQVVGGSMLAVWGERGQDAKPGTLFWANFDLRTYAFSQPGSAPVAVPYPLANLRHISDVRVDPAGGVFISAASDPGKDGPFASAIYFIGTLGKSDGRSVTLKQTAPLTRLFQFSGHKVEAIEFVPGADGGVVFGTDDENLGAAIYFDW